MNTPKAIKIDGFKVADRRHKAVWNVDIVYFGKENFIFPSAESGENDKGIKAPDYCEWVTGFAGKTASLIKKSGKAILYVPVKSVKETVKAEAKKPEIEQISLDDYEIAPDDHVMVSMEDIFQCRKDYSPYYDEDSKVKPLPRGYEWVKGYAGKKAKVIKDAPGIFVDVLRPKKKVAQETVTILTPPKGYAQAPEGYVADENTMISCHPSLGWTKNWVGSRLYGKTIREMERIGETWYFAVKEKVDLPDGYIQAPDDYKADENTMLSMIPYFWIHNAKTSNVYGKTAKEASSMGITWRYAIKPEAKVIKPIEPIKDCPEGYELAPSDHIAVRHVDLLKLRKKVDNLPSNEKGVLPPEGYEWVTGYSGQIVGSIVGNYYTGVYRPIKKESKTYQCKHKNCYSSFRKEWDDVKPLEFKWCRDCGAFYHPTGKKWLYPKGK